MYIGVDVGGMSIKAGLVDLNGKIVARQSVVTRAKESESAIIDDIAGLIRDLTLSCGMSMSDILGVGIGLPGAVNDDMGIVRYCCNINFVEVALVAELQKRLDFENIYISNDANCAVLGEVVFGIAKGKRDVVLITLGTGLGTGIITGGQLLKGHQSAGAEGGHMTINIGGPVCGCGKKGHFESYASATALLAQVKEAMEKHPESLLHEVAKNDGFDGKTVFTASKMGDKVAIRVLNRYLKYVGIGLVNFANLFYPEMIIIGGGISNQGDNIIKKIEKYVNKNIYSAGLTPKIKVTVSDMKNDAGIIGAACLAIKN